MRNSNQWKENVSGFLERVCAVMVICHLGRVGLAVVSFENSFLARYLSISAILKMPPKKKEEEKRTPLMGRFGTSLKCGIVGLPNVG